MTTFDEYAELVDTTVSLLENNATAGARIILASFLAVDANVAQVAGLMFIPEDTRRVYFERSAKDALAMLDGQLEDTALAELRLCRVLMQEASTS